MTSSGGETVMWNTMFVIPCPASLLGQLWRQTRVRKKNSFAMNPRDDYAEDSSWTGDTLLSCTQPVRSSPALPAPLRVVRDPRLLGQDLR